ncbi:MAG TPA: hypothetical protein VKG45_00915 [Actinomycetes bacterium]|nr:hypothetical protein [Actinomycetes bacterium]
MVRPTADRRLLVPLLVLTLLATGGLAVGLPAALADGDPAGPDSVDLAPGAEPAGEPTGVERAGGEPGGVELAGSEPGGGDSSGAGPVADASGIVDASGIAGLAEGDRLAQLIDPAQATGRPESADRTEVTDRNEVADLPEVPDLPEAPPADERSLAARRETAAGTGDPGDPDSLLAATRAPVGPRVQGEGSGMPTAIDGIILGLNPRQTPRENIDDALGNIAVSVGLVDNALRGAEIFADRAISKADRDDPQQLAEARSAARRADNLARTAEEEAFSAAFLANVIATHAVTLSKRELSMLGQDDPEAAAARLEAAAARLDAAWAMASASMLNSRAERARAAAGRAAEAVSTAPTR